MFLYVYTCHISILRGMQDLIVQTGNVKTLNKADLSQLCGHSAIVLPRRLC